MKKLTSLLLALIMLFTALTLSGCFSKYKLEDGMKLENKDYIKNYFCGYTSETNTFNVDDVTLTFYYGYGTCDNLPYFKIYFENEVGDVYLIKEITEYEPDEYDTVWNSTGIIDLHPDMEYNHSEKITIPKELFANESGYILFVLATNPEYQVALNDTTGVLRERKICYQIKDGKVLLSKGEIYID